MKNLQIFKLNPEAIIPTRNLVTDAGIDIYSVVDMFIPVHDNRIVTTGVAINIPDGYVGKIEDRSSMGKKGLRVGGGVIDTGYSGSLDVMIHNLSFDTDHNFHGLAGYHVRKGDKIAQMLIIKVELPEIVEVNELWKSERGNKSFGSSGR